MRERLWWSVRNSNVARRLLAWPLLAGILRRVSYLLLPSSTHKILQVRNGLGEGLWLELSPRWESHIWQGPYEPAVQQVVYDYFKPGKTVYDVGGGIGFYALVAARLGAQVFTFEPDPKNFDCIERNARTNHLGGSFNLMRLAAFSRTGTLVMEPSDRRHGHGHAHAKEIWDSGVHESFEAACTTLDDFARENPLPDLIKIDVEGCEAAVVKGAGLLMRDVRPAILCEVHDVELANEVETLVRSRGYKVAWLDDPDYPVRWIYATADAECRT